MEDCQPETYNKDGTVTHYGSDGKTVTSKDYPDGGHYDATTGIYTAPDGSQAQVGPDGPAC